MGGALSGRQEKTCPVGMEIKWVGYYVCVQYRDAMGNISLIYSDDISVEDIPVSPTP
jgi:hypothetical protein